MKKSKFLLMTVLALPLLVACTETTFIPRFSYPGDPIHGDAGGGNAGGSGEGGDIDVSEANMTVNFYLDYSHSDEPIYSMRWYMLKPLGDCPKEAVLTDAKAADPLYTSFLGYSEYPSAIDESLLWNFKEDYKQSNVLNLYGIWVCKQEVAR